MHLVSLHDRLWLCNKIKLNLNCSLPTDTNSWGQETVLCGTLEVGSVHVSLSGSLDVIAWSCLVLYLGDCISDWILQYLFGKALISMGFLLLELCIFLIAESRPMARP
jgi:hypothetical protein